MLVKQPGNRGFLTRRASVWGSLFPESSASKQVFLMALTRTLVSFGFETSLLQKGSLPQNRGASPQKRGSCPHARGASPQTSGHDPVCPRKRRVGKAKASSVPGAGDDAPPELEARGFEAAGCDWLPMSSWLLVFSRLGRQLELQGEGFGLVQMTLVRLWVCWLTFRVDGIRGAKNLAFFFKCVDSSVHF